MPTTPHTLAALSLAAALSTLPLPGMAGVVSIVNFETNPVLALAPSIYVAVPGPQTFTTPEAVFSGGVALGFATFFPAISFATVPNVYGTADFGNRLARSLSIDINPAFATTEVSFVLFNGEVFSQTYQVNAFNGAALVASQTLLKIPANFFSGYAIVDLISGAGITHVDIAPTGAPSVWDFLIDTVNFNQSIVPGSPPPPPVVLPPVVLPPPTPPVHGHRHGHKKGETELLEVNFGDDVNDIRGNAITLLPVPEPATWAMLLAGFASIACMARRRQDSSKSQHLQAATRLARGS